MLVELKVSHFAIIEQIHIQFTEGLNILSGETGAGKSVLLKSLGLLMGSKAASDTVMSGKKSAVVEGVFDLQSRTDTLDRLETMGIDTSDDLLVVRRVISAQGKSRVYLNGALSALANLRDIVVPLIEVTGDLSPLIEMTGQHDNRQLLSPQYHLDLLDRYASGWTLRQKVKDTYTQWQQTQKEICELNDTSQSDQQRLDFLNYQLEELRDFDLDQEKDQELESHISRLKNASRLIEFVDQAEASLYGEEDSALVRLHRVIQAAQDLGRVDPGIHLKVEGLTQAKALIEESIYELREFGREVSGDPTLLGQMEDRLSRLRHLQRKYGQDFLDIQSAEQRIEKEISEISNSDERVRELKKLALGQKASLMKMGKRLHNLRVDGARKLETGVNRELTELNMKDSRLQIDVMNEKEPSSTGLSQVGFLLKAGQKEEARPLQRVASGGELSRILLSLKHIVGESEQPRTYLFDEVDTGVSGPTAQKVGAKLKGIAEGQQVICVTHLPQVAAQGHSHFLIRRTATDERDMEVIKLKKAERVQELARLISGEKITDSSLRHAKQLLNS